ncbi:DNRLRE domain-containing protein, partial [bacterium]|nr:DNRLRE domain-containing protein [bacterium]
MVVGSLLRPAEANQPPILRTSKVFQQQDSVEEGQPYQGCQDAWYWDENNRDWSSNELGQSVRIVIRFSDLPIPSGAEVEEAILQMYMYELGAGSGSNIYVYGVKRDWVVNEVTAVEYRSGNNWEMAGGDGPSDRTQVAADTVQLSSGAGWRSWDAKSIAQSWISGEFDNNGFMLVGQGGDSGWNSDRTKFHAESFGINEEQKLFRPKLLLSWSPAEIPDQALIQNQNYQNLFDLDDYFYDPDGDSLSYSCIGNTHVTVIIDEENRVDMVPEQDWIGAEQVQFIADDGHGGTLSSNFVQIKVQGASVSIPNQRWSQGYSYINALDLDDYFLEEGLTFTASTEDNPNIDVVINPDHTIDFNQLSSFYGTESVVFTGTGSQGDYLSNSVLLTVDKPEYETVLTDHPKIYICPENFNTLKDRIEEPDGPLASLFNSFKSEADANEFRDKTYGWYGFVSDGALEEIVMLGYLYQMTGDVAYANSIVSAMEWLPNYDGAASSPTNKASTLEGLALGFDMAYDRIVELGRRDEFIEDIVTYADREKQSLIDDLYTDFHNYFTHKSTAVLFAGLALYGEHTKASEYLDFALECFRGDLTNTGTTASLKFLDGDGNWEGSTYARQSLWHMNRFVKGWQTGNDNAVNWYNDMIPEFENSGYAQIYYMRPDKIMVKAGDCTYPWAQDKDAFSLWAFQGEYQNQHFTWICENTWTDYLHGILLNSGLDKDNTWYKRKVWAFLWWDPSVPAENINNLPLSREYKTGEVIMRSDWADDATYIMFKRPTYHFGGHLHLDQNSFTIYKNGPLATHSGYFSSGGDHRWNYYRRSIAHNSVLVKDPSYSIVHGNSNNQYMDFYNDGGYRFVWARHDPPHAAERGWSNEPRWLPDGSVVA